MTQFSIIPLLSVNDRAEYRFLAYSYLYLDYKNIFKKSCNKKVKKSRDGYLKVYRKKILLQRKKRIFMGNNGKSDRGGRKRAPASGASGPSLFTIKTTAQK